jgi:hypothetical protein
MRRQVVVVGLVVIVALLAAGPAWAKGPSGATIEGPGLDEPIVIAGSGERGAPGEFSRFVEAAGFWQLVFGAVGGRAGVIEEPTTADLGPVYVLTWRLGMTEVPAQVYPYASGGPLVRVEPSQMIVDFGTSTTGGWFLADPALADLMNGYGVPTMAVLAGSDGPVQEVASTLAAEPAPASREPVDEPASVSPSRVGSVQVVTVLALAVVLGAGIVWAMGRRPRRIGAP